MIRRCLFAVLGLLLMASPSAAVDPVEPFAPKGRAAEFVAGLPGAREGYQIDLLEGDFRLALDAFTYQWGTSPTSLQQLEDAGFLPYRPTDALGAPMPFLPLNGNQLPPSGTVGVEFREETIRIVMMGAEGDPLSPLIKVVNLQAHAPRIPVAFPVESRRVLVLRGGIGARLGAWYSCFGRYPTSLADVNVTFGWEPYNHTQASPAGKPGLEVGIDGTSGALRYDLTPNPLSAPMYSWVGQAPRPNWNYRFGTGLQVPVLGMAGSFAPIGGASLKAYPNAPTSIVQKPMNCYLEASSYNSMYGISMHKGMDTLAGFLAAHPPKGSVAEAVRAARCIVELPTGTDGKALAWFDIDKEIATAERNPNAPYQPDTRPEGFYLWFDGTTAGYVLQASMSSRSSLPHPSQATQPARTPASQVRQAIDDLRTKSGEPLPELLESALVAKWIQESDGPNEMRLAGFVTHFIESLEGYTRSKCELPSTWDAYLTLGRVKPVNYDPQPSRVSPKAGSQALTIEVDETGLFARMIVEPTLPLTGTFYFRLSGGNNTGASFTMVDVTRNPEVMKLSYRVLMSTLVPTD